MQKRTEYRRWSNGQLVEERITIEDEDGELIFVKQDPTSDDAEEPSEQVECGFRGEYGEVEEIFDEEDDDE